MRFRLVDRILELEPGRRIVAVKAVSFEEYQLQRRHGVDDELPGTLLVEALLQAGNWLILASSDFSRLGLVARIGCVTLRRAVRRGERVRLDVRLASVRPDGALLHGTGTVGDEEVLVGQGCVATFVPARDFEDPADLRVLFEEIAPGLASAACPELTEVPGHGQ